jgi:hypothetical protein
MFNGVLDQGTPPTPAESDVVSIVSDAAFVPQATLATDTHLFSETLYLDLQIFRLCPPR